MTVCDFTLSVKVMPSDGSSTPHVDLNDEAAGYVVRRPLVPPMPSWSSERVTSDDVDGSYRASRRREDNAYPIRVGVLGSTWPETETRLAALLDALDEEPDFFLETVIEGVTRRWSAEWERAELEDVDLKNTRMTVRLTFRVQPSPTVTTV